MNNIKNEYTPYEYNEMKDERVTETEWKKMDKMWCGYVMTIEPRPNEK